MPDIIGKIREAYAMGEIADILHTLIPELLKTADEGKIVVLPCKVGDTVFVTTSERVTSKIEEITIRANEIVFIWAQYDEGYEQTELWDEGEFLLEDIGKTVFLTHESAEAALREREL